MILINQDMLIRSTQEDAKTFRGIAGGRSATRSVSVGRYLRCREGAAWRGCKPDYLGPTGSTSADCTRANARATKSSPIHSGVQERLGTPGQFLTQPDKHEPGFQTGFTPQSFHDFAHRLLRYGYA
jgi:hypothetical protein